jgi:Zn-dependent protease
VNLVLASGFAIYIYFAGDRWIPAEGFDGLMQFPVVLMWMNLVLFLFNLIPAFPMDGGRILRSGLAFVMPHRRATLVAGLMGQMCAVAFIIYGVLNTRYSLVLIGAFIYLAARSEMEQSRLLFEHEQFVKAQLEAIESGASVDWEQRSTGV